MNGYDWAERVWFWADDPPLVYPFSRRRRRRDFYGVRMRLRDRRRLAHGQPPPIRPADLPPRSRWRAMVRAWQVAPRHFMAPRSMWREGPWTGEPDELYWRHEPSGYPCAIWRNLQGVLCGYVGVPPGHPLHGESAEAASEVLSAHGGLTFASTFEHRRLASPEGFRLLPVWWFLGFDCGHAFDLSPAIDSLTTADPAVRAWRSSLDAMLDELPGLRFRETYKDVETVRVMVESLAEQAARIVTGGADLKEGTTSEHDGG